MPNWCENELRVSGKKKDIEAFLEAVRGSRDDDTVFDFEKIVPYPEEYSAADRAAREWDEKYKDVPWGERPLDTKPKDGYNSGGYNWCINNWGTKWPASDTNVYLTSRGCNFNFNTAWSPPTPIVERAAELFPDLTFHLKYWEGGAGFKGSFKAKGEMILENEEDNYRGNRGG